MKTKLLELLHSHVYYIALVGMFLFAMSLAVYQTSCKTDVLPETIRTNKTETQSAVLDAANAQKRADDTSVERRTEDTIRERVITPKLEAARRQSAQSAEAAAAARRKYNEQKQNPHNPNASRADNCAELHRLFPTERFEYCND